MKRILYTLAVLAAVSLASSFDAGAQSRDKVLADPAGPEWLKTAVFYEIYPLTFQDSDGDGVGDLKGITSRLEYVRSLGVNAIWLNPMFCSEFQDAGYDITDFYKVDPRFGTNEDLVNLLHRAHELGMKVCLDLVAGHSSDKCEWFTQSSQDKYGRYADYYIWVDKLDAEEQKQYDSGKSNFVKTDSPRGGYYVKNYYDCQPALNYGYARPDPTKPWQQSIDAPGPKAVLREMLNIMRFWMDKGFDGYRVDMASSLVKNDYKEKDVTKTIWREIRAWMDKNYPEKVLIAEWSNPLNAIPAGFHIDFILPWRNTFGAELYHPVGIRYNKTDPCWFDMAGKGTAKHFLGMFQQYYDKTRGLGYFAVPTSNHDQPRLNLRDRSTPDQLKVMMTFFMTLPGVPYIYYGDEIGMRYVENLPDKEGSTPIRAGSRTPMQWEDGPCAGFSACDPSRLYLPVYPHGEDGKTELTVAAEDRDPQSLLNFTRSLIDLRKSSPALGNCGAWKLLSDPEVAYPMVYERSSGSERYIIVLNPSAATVSTTLVPDDAEPVSVVGKYNLRRGTLTAKGVGAFIFRCRQGLELPDMESSTAVIDDRQVFIPYSIAHRAGHIDGLVPENSPEGVRMAARYGFRAIECDAHYTADSVMILMHDRTINRTCRRKADYSKIEEPMKYSQMSFKDLRNNYVLASDDKSLRTKVPTLEEQLMACKKYGIVPMIHSDLPEAFELAYRMLGDGFIAFDTSYEAMKAARRISKGCMVLWDPGTAPAEEAIAKLDAIGGKCGVSSMKSSLLTKEYVGKIRNAGYEVQASIWNAPGDIDAVSNGCTMILSDFVLFPVSHGDAFKVAPAVDVKGRVLEAGESLDYTFDSTEYGSIMLMMDISGDVEFTVCGGKPYSLCGDGVRAMDGWRFHACAPAVRIVARQHTMINSLKVYSIKYDK